jgi:BirA family biotin operon repressor/biotin-[acetyl-CoA-carboxylase] ligase
MDRLSGDRVRHKLATRTFGQNVVYTEKIGSTNTELKTFARRGAPEGLLYLTDEQMAGRGRVQGRKWVAPAGSSLLLSLLFRPGVAVGPHQAQRLTMLCALAMIDAIEIQTGLIPDIKWPNDLLWKDGKKLAGILTELEVEDNRLVWAVVGIGLNVNLDFTKQADLDTGSPGQAGNGGPPLFQTATSLSMILGRDTRADRLPILQRFLEKVERRYDALQQGKLFHQEWSRRLTGLGQSVIITGPDKTYRGIMAGVDENGALLLRQSDNSIVTILAGDVTLRSN